MIEYVMDNISKFINRKHFKTYFDWFIKKFTLIEKSEELERCRKNNIHPIRPRKGEIYLIEFGQNVEKNYAMFIWELLCRNL